jgi:plastocyanin
MSKRKRLIFTAIAVALVGIVTGLLLRGASTPPPVSTLKQAANEVAILGRAFIPRIMTVTAGTTVTWTNLEEAEAHVPTSDDGLFEAELALNDSFSYTFNEPGTFIYHCAAHYSDMFDAKVIVE